MTSPSHSDRLLDLIYGELTPEEEAELHRALEEDEELANELRELRKTRAEVRRHIPDPQEVGEEVAQKILGRAARQDDAEDADESARPPRAVRSNGGLWGDFFESGAVRAATSVAVMLLVCGGVYYAMFGLDAPPGPLTSQVQQAASPTGEDKGVKKEAQPIEEADEFAEGEAEAPAGDQEEAAAPQEATDREAKEIAEQVADDGRESTSEAARRGRARSAKRASGEERKQRVRAAKPARREKSQVDEQQRAAAKKSNSSNDGLAERAPKPAPRPDREANKQGRAESNADLQPMDDASDGAAAAPSEDRAGSAEPEQKQQDKDEDDAPSSAEQLLTDARKALDDGDEARARLLVDRLYEEEDVDSLDDEQRRQADDLRRRLAPEPRDADPKPTIQTE